VKRRQRSPGRAAEPFTNEPKGPLELLGALAGQTTYRVPAYQHDTPPPLVIAGALGMVKNRLGGLLAEGVATRNAALIAPIVRAAFKRSVHRVANAPPRDMNSKALADRWRMRVVLFDAVSDLMFPERQLSIPEAAKRSKMRRSTYLDLYSIISSELAEQLGYALGEFKKRMNLRPPASTSGSTSAGCGVDVEPHLTGAAQSNSVCHAEPRVSK
jgi:hypothetical protein